MGKKEVCGVAESELGYLEKSLADWKKYGTKCLYEKTKYAGSDNVQKYAWETGHYKTVGWAPWCMSFIVWVFMAVQGKNDADKLLCGMFNSASTMETKNAMIKAGRQVSLSKADAGDIVFRSRSGGGHVGLVVGRSDSGKIISVEGNTSATDATAWNGGCVAQHVGGSWEWCCRPDWSLVEKKDEWRWLKVNGVWYYQNGEGKNSYGWRLIKESGSNKQHWYYFAQDGAMMTGAVWVNNKLYLLMDSGDLEGACMKTDDTGAHYIWDVE